MEIINFLKNFAENSGITAVVVLILTVIITNLIKIPLKNHAAKIAALAQKGGFGVTKDFIESKVAYIPFGVSFALFCIAGAIGLAFGSAFDIASIIAQTPVIAAASIGLYSLIHNTVKHAAEKAEYEKFLKSQTAAEDKPAEPAPVNIDQTVKDSNDRIAKIVKDETPAEPASPAVAETPTEPTPPEPPRTPLPAPHPPNDDDEQDIS